MKNFKRKRVLLAGLIVLALCVGVLNSKLTDQRLLQTSGEYVDYETQQMALYAEDLAVVSSETYDSEEVTLVSSDDYSDLNDSSTFFEEARAALNMDRNEIISMLTEFSEESEDETAKEQAVQKKLTLIEYMSKEVTIENLLKNKGFEDVYVVMTDSAVNVTLNKEELTDVDVAQVVDVVCRETGRDPSQIVVQNKL
ncbi:MAG: SpoIIIAH-like family protein [Firmicutes bacterium]|nr:SpoIIIAH-like family protein [Clostridiales bacterium]MBQ2845696.1 SpoIIIAH-like family protein [Bacillota bacterium]MBQ4339814.1 SpoIIIAH-like family protein [Bacillota bacterium]MBR6700513.1 SpoIIIAH-like family protein [Bacillota bacterium]